MDKDCCIYFEAGSCTSMHVARTRPDCPYWGEAGQCTCGGRLGALGQREWRPQPKTFIVPGTPVPLAIRG